ncbi:uncharacterized protein SCDLUD_002970 [Saccharomycodes ludwigii]|uniref:uncharacterized protein n=1 Tax=Saccharomycodes ludwigii TaxID=36035 RepID=UPI001E84693B|nr:hypothetical protein SCDLUD_002970 [Saccharomycodes ludwigii]KAH3901475.1 hypothetical protein SCDLUD_002970 [Saccharomycodes ludwigii]
MTTNDKTSSTNTTNNNNAQFSQSIESDLLLFEFNTPLQQQKSLLLGHTRSRDSNSSFSTNINTISELSKQGNNTYSYRYTTNNNNRNNGNSSIPSTLIDRTSHHESNYDEFINDPLEYEGAPIYTGYSNSLILPSDSNSGINLDEDDEDEEATLLNKSINNGSIATFHTNNDELLDDRLHRLSLASKAIPSSINTLRMSGVDKPIVGTATKNPSANQKRSHSAGNLSRLGISDKIPSLVLGSATFNKKSKKKNIDRHYLEILSKLKNKEKTQKMKNNENIMYSKYNNYLSDMLLYNEDSDKHATNNNKIVEELVDQYWIYGDGPLNEDMFESSSDEEDAFTFPQHGSYNKDNLSQIIT